MNWLRLIKVSCAKIIWYWRVFKDHRVGSKLTVYRTAYEWTKGWSTLFWLFFSRALLVISLFYDISFNIGGITNFLLLHVSGAQEPRWVMPRLPLNLILSGKFPMYDDNARIVGGTVVSPHSLPFQAMLERSNALGVFSLSCGGSVSLYFFLGTPTRTN